VTPYARLDVEAVCLYAKKRGAGGGTRGAAVKISWTTIAPVVVWLVLYLIPGPAGTNL
jgi:hypothetical protein